MRDRLSIRLKHYDYSKNGYYFVTICTENKICYFGNIINGVMRLSDIGKMAAKFWIGIPVHYPDVELDEFIIMPNHIHGIIKINIVGVQNFEPLRNKYQYIIPRSLGSIIRGYKIGVTKWCRDHQYDNSRWQRNFYDHIIRDEKSLNQIRQYIINNPKKRAVQNFEPLLPKSHFSAQAVSAGSSVAIATDDRPIL